MNYLNPLLIFQRVKYKILRKKKHNQIKVGLMKRNMKVDLQVIQNKASCSMLMKGMLMSISI